MQREIEARGLSTVLITVSPEQSAAINPPRAFCPRGFGIGRILGSAGDRATHRKVVEMALAQLVGPAHPGQVITAAI